MLFFLLGELPVVLRLVCLLWLPGSLDVQRDLDEVVIGVDGGALVDVRACVGGDVLDHASPGLWAEGVVKLDLFSVGALVCDALRRGLLHPGLWEAEFVGLAKLVKGCGVALLCL